MSRVLIVGAGFNIDASDAAGITNRRYPLLNDLARKCFDIVSPTADLSIEKLFQDALDRRERMPFERLADQIMEADYFIAQPLSRTDNIYIQFLRTFVPDTVITFNYDSLIELLLFRNASWIPEDGYGVPVQAERGFYPGFTDPLASSSSALVFHVHGTLCLYASEYRIKPDPISGMGWLEIKEEPDFIFDPDQMTHCFTPYTRILPTTGYERIDRRILAPIPNKAEGLREVYITKVRERSKHLLTKADTVLAVGYRFNPTDQVSYDGLLSALPEIQVTLVLPEALEVTARLEQAYPRIGWKPQPMTFRDWAESGFLQP